MSGQISNDHLLIFIENDMFLLRFHRLILTNEESTDTIIIFIYIMILGCTTFNTKQVCANTILNFHYVCTIVYKFDPI